ncbi:hypothetical protein [Avibacterium endocarditidis]|uniref:hypothetical protein n=1 Tax=Avibacterium TaxID=292486 RepID=UPI0039FD7E4A
MEMNNNFYQMIIMERERLKNSAFPEYRENDGMGANFLIRCNGNAAEVLGLAKNVLLAINEQYTAKTWPSNQKWHEILPKNFLKNFKKEEGKSAKKWWSNFFHKIVSKKSEDNRWTFENWIFLMEPIDRSWFWWGATVIDEEDGNNYLFFTTRVLDDPFSSGTLKWLFIGAGAVEILDEDEFSKRFNIDLIR